MIGHIDVLDKGFVELQDWMGGDLAVVQAARVSTLSDSKGDESDRKLINYLMKNRHSSPFEMCEFKFRINCPLLVARQILRHRTANINEVSRRYTSENIEFFIPDYFRKQAKNNRQASTDETITYLHDWGDLDNPQDEGVPVREAMLAYVDYCLDFYNLLLANGVAREQARMVLPQNMYTMFIFKIDLHNLFHFLGLRADAHAQWETQQYAQAMGDLIKGVVPWSYEAWETWGKTTV